MKADFRKKLEVVYNRAEKTNIEVARYRHLLKYAQHRIKNKIIYLTKKFNKKIKKRIVYNNIFNGEKENLKTKRRNKKFLTFLSISKF